MDALEKIVRQTYDQLVGLEFGEVTVDCCITKAPCECECECEKAGSSPVDRGERGIKRSVAVDAGDIPLAVVTAPANRHDPPLLAQTLDAAGRMGLLPKGASIRLDRGYDSQATREKPRDRGLIPEISEKGRPAPVAATGRWIVEHTNSWQAKLDHKKLGRCTERSGRVIDLWVAFSNAVIIVGRLVREAWSRYRWDGRRLRRP